MKHKRAGKALGFPSSHKQMGERPGQLFITPIDWKMQGINEWIKAQKAEFSSCISGFSSADFPPSPEVLLGALGWGRALVVKRGWLQLLSVLTLFIMAVPSMAPTLCQAFPSPHAGSAEVMTCVPSTVILALSGSARGSGIGHCPEAKPDQCWERKPFLHHLHQHTLPQTGVKQKLAQK